MKTRLRTWWGRAKARMTALGTKTTTEEEYLAEAVDMVDFEQRMRQLERQITEGAFVRLRVMARARA